MAVSIVSSSAVLLTSDALTDYAASTPFAAEGGAGRVLIAFVSDCINTAGQTFTVTANGAAMTEITFAEHSAGGSRTAQGVYAISCASGGDYSIAFGCDTVTTAGRSAAIFCMEIDGADIANLTGTVWSVEGAPPATSVTPTTSGSRVFGFLSSRRGVAQPFTPHAGVTEILDETTGSTATNDHSVWAGYVDAVDTSSLDLGADATTTDDSVFSAVEILEASGGGGVAGVTGSGAALETGADAAAGAGEVLIIGTGAAAESGTDTAAGSGTTGAAPLVTSIGLGSVQEAGNDTAAGSGSVAVNGAGSALEAGSDAAAGRGRGTAEIPETPLARVVAVSPQSRTVNAAAQVRLVTVPAANFVTRAT